MPTDHATIGRFLRSDEWMEHEKFAIKWQYRLLGQFETALMEAIRQADEDNLRLLERGFPEQVDGYRAWVHGDLGARLRKAGLAV